MTNSGDAIRGDKNPMHRPEVKEKFRARRLGHTVSDETRKKQSDAKLGDRNHNYRKPRSEETKQKIRNSERGKIISVEARERIKKTANLPEVKSKIRSAKLGSKNPQWKGEITPLQRSIRNGSNYSEWVLHVFQRDKFTCKFCNNIGGDLEAHHIKHFAKILEENHITTFDEALNCVELWDISNGVTLCKDCHKKEHAQKDNTHDRK